MSYVKNDSYREIQFSSGTPINEFYTFTNIRDLAAKCELQADEIARCRTIGILQSVNGRFYLSDIEKPFQTKSDLLVQVSMVYLKSPPQSTVMPYPVQVFGMSQWKNQPVIFAKILQVLSVRTAIRLNSALTSIVKNHLADATNIRCDEQETGSNLS